MKAVVTGGAGFIGSNLARHLVDSGNEVVAFDNLSTGDPANLDEVDLTFLKGDIRDLSELEDCLGGVEVVFHQAALPSVARSLADPVASHANNATGTLNVLEAARKAGVRRVVYASSSSVYGKNPNLPKNEADSTMPMSPYAAAKLTGEHYCRVYSELFELETVSLRYFNVFGPRQDPTSQYSAVIPKFISALLSGSAPTIYGDGEQSRDFTYIDNVVHANRLAAEAGVDCSGEHMNIAIGARVSLNDLLGLLAEILKIEAVEPVYLPPRAGDIRHSLADISRAEDLIGYQPIVELRQGLERTIDWYRYED